MPIYTPARGNVIPNSLPAAVRNWLVACYLADPTPSQLQLTGDSNSETIVFVRFEYFAKFLVDAGIDLLPNLDHWKSEGWIEDIMVDITPSDELNKALPCSLARLNLSYGRHRLVGIRQSIICAPTDYACTNSDSGRSSQHVDTTQVPKKSTERGDGRAKLISALLLHHQYDNGIYLNLVPIGNNELATAAGVSNSTASEFFRDKFQGHTKYKACCRDSGMLLAALKMLCGDYAPHILYGSEPLEHFKAGKLNRVESGQG